MSWFKDSCGNIFTTTDGQPPSVPNIPVTIANGSGQINNGTWNGATANPNPAPAPPPKTDK